MCSSPSTTWIQWIPWNLSFRYISLYWSIHTKDETKRGTEFAFIFGVNWLCRWGATASLGVFFHEIRCNGMTSSMEFMITITYPGIPKVPRARDSGTPGYSLTGLSRRVSPWMAGLTTDNVLHPTWSWYRLPTGKSLFFDSMTLPWGKWKRNNVQLRKNTVLSHCM